MVIKMLRDVLAELCIYVKGYDEMSSPERDTVKRDLTVSLNELGYKDVEDYTTVFFTLMTASQLEKDSLVKKILKTYRRVK